jgi:leucyl-tRNA synthetase
VLETLVTLLAPFTPHIAEELWHMMGHTTTVCDAAWPEFDEAHLKEDTVTLGVSFNGKTRFTLDFPVDATKEQIEETTLASDLTKKYLDGKNIVKMIVVPGRIINIVVK